MLSSSWLKFLWCARFRAMWGEPSDSTRPRPTECESKEVIDIASDVGTVNVAQQNRKLWKLTGIFFWKVHQLVWEFGIGRARVEINENLRLNYFGTRSIERWNYQRKKFSSGTKSRSVVIWFCTHDSFGGEFRQRSGKSPRWAWRMWSDYRSLDKFMPQFTCKMICKVRAVFCVWFHKSNRAEIHRRDRVKILEK